MLVLTHAFAMAHQVVHAQWYQAGQKSFSDFGDQQNSAAHNNGLPEIFLDDLDHGSDSLDLLDVIHQSLPGLTLAFFTSVRDQWVEAVPLPVRAAHAQARAPPSSFTLL
jgi:hypothetical protein